ncbi:hepatocellular carcinoma-associated antigen 59-domain-containing protein [Pseudoneurospora amorphoporcata]|uniref:Hepatocellular carcinoma-associated antigen 59-domain-containing protein n=1 Tax=Pseudoneurospora amorphoporcata TaxID=241081 RepID=A0AAN6P2A5_9PEZI|nr:hepatocellular carcinoma-associated antigen 59-domain-containing protein [Pseudoneurospora amorphoporcata]
MDASAPTPEPTAAAPPPVFFRAGKKKRAFRQRAEETDAEPAAQTDSWATINTSSDATATGQTAASTTEPAVSGTVATATTAGPTAKREEDKEGGGLSVTEVLRLRNAKKHRLGGVAFRAGDVSSPTPQNAEQAMVLHDSGSGGAEVQEAAILGGVAKRFAPQTGMVGELVNKHMEEYIESELARRKRLAAEHRAQHEGGQNGGSSSSNAMTNSMPNLLAADPTLSVGGGKVESQRALHGKLMEIDLGEEARARNIAETERARRRLEGQILEEEEDADGRRKKVRLGPDGKPWRSRNRRDSDALKRDQQVEEFLRENRLDVYDVPSDQPEYATNMEDDEMAADDRIAEEFRRDFMDAMSQRHRRRRPAVNATARPSARNQDAEILKGPKLGGSRNARAAMREKLLREQEQSKRR